MDRILITGASGFVGQAVVARLLADGHRLTLALRRPMQSMSACRQVIVGDLIEPVDWRDALEGCTAAVHLAAATPASGADAHVLGTVNDAATARLAEQAAASGLRLLVFLSSIAAVAGHASREAVTDRTEPAPVSAYGRSKLAAEAHVAAFARAGRIGVSLRPPLVYGASARGSWGMLQKLAASGLPLPFGAIRNRRSLVARGALADAIATVLVTPRPAGGSFGIADGPPLGLGDMIRLLREGMGLGPRLLPVPASLVEKALGALGRGAMIESLTGDLVVDPARFRALYNWTPPHETREAIRRCGAAYRAQRQG